MTGDTRFTLLASYNQWMNRRLYDTVATLPHEAIVADRGAFFVSILGTLNHLVVTDTIWLKRFAAAPDAPGVLAALDGTPMPAALDAILYPTLPLLRERREWMDALILQWAATLTAERLDASLTYANTKGTTFTRSVLGLATHLFNHQTHHRGQAHAILTALGKPSLLLDLVYFQRTDGAQWG